MKSKISRALKPRRAMFAEERIACQALGGCRFLPGTSSKRFARQMAAEAVRMQPEITEGQAGYLRTVCWHFRRQLPRAVVEWADMNMSFFYTQQQIRDRSKDVTRRIGWEKLKPGQRFTGIVKGQGLKKGEKVEVLAQCECVSNRPEPLNAITPDDCRREGYPDKTPDEFIEMFCKHHGCVCVQPVNRIEFKYVEV